MLNGSPYEREKDDVRRELVTRRAAEAGCALAYVNMVGGQDDLVFDGDSIVVGADGEVLARARQFSETLLVVDLDLPRDPTHDESPQGLTGVRHVVVTAEPVPAYSPDPALRAPATIADPLDGAAEVYEALVVGLRDYVRKNGFRSVVLGLSGGIDSTIVATIACDAIGPQNVVGVSMPSRYSSEHSKDDAADLAKRTGLDYRIVPIAPMVQAFLDTLGLTGIAEENLQARVRGVVLMGLSNQEGHLTLTTGNKSELAVGYSTIYGDSVGGFNPVKDVPKTLVWALAHWRNAEALRRGDLPPIPESSITKAPSAELRPGQTDQDSLPPYDLLDAAPRAVRRGGARPVRAARGRLRPRDDRRGRDDGRPCRVEAPAVRAGAEDLPGRVRPGPPAADHEPVARTRVVTRATSGPGVVRRSGADNDRTPRARGQGGGER